MSDLIAAEERILRLAPSSGEHTLRTAPSGGDRTLRSATSAEERTLHEDEGAHHVDIQQAEYVFNQLSRSLSQRSQPEKPGDVEKSEDAEGRFDLREYLQSSNDANQSAGIKHKHVGVTWEDLQVEIIGGGDFKVRIIAGCSRSCALI